MDLKREDETNQEAYLMPRWLNLILAAPLLYAGFVQSFWGNDPYLGWAITVIAGGVIADPIFHYAKWFGISKSRRQGIAIMLFFLIMWVSLGVGELPRKTDMMLESLPRPNITGI
ncbi:MAG: hypothetical protein VW840_19820 [Gammaproteobacteria bacterium]